MFTGADCSHEALELADSSVKGGRDSQKKFLDGSIELIKSLMDGFRTDHDQSSLKMALIVARAVHQMLSGDSTLADSNQRVYLATVHQVAKTAKADGQLELDIAQYEYFSLDWQPYLNLVGITTRDNR